MILLLTLPVCSHAQFLCLNGETHLKGHRRGLCSISCKHVSHYVFPYSAVSAVLKQPLPAFAHQAMQQQHVA